MSKSEIFPELILAAALVLALMIRTGPAIF